MIPNVALSNVKPSAVMSPEEIRRWKLLGRDEQIAVMRQVLQEGFDSGVSDESLDVVRAEVHAEFLEAQDS